jgi:hypothetical protein
LFSTQVGTPGRCRLIGRPPGAARPIRYTIGNPVDLRLFLVKRVVVVFALGAEVKGA